MSKIKRMSKQTGGDLFEFRDAPLFRALAKKKKRWPLLIETPLGLYDPRYRVDLRESGGNMKDRLNKTGECEPFNVQMAKIVGLTETEFPSTVSEIDVELRTDKDFENVVAKMTSVTTDEGKVEFDYPFTPNCMTFTEELKSPLWLFHLKNLRERDPFVFNQAATKIAALCKQVREHRETVHRDGAEGETVSETLENNLLLLSRYWEWLGIDLNLHVTRFPDHPFATVSMTGHGRVQRGIELKYDSNGYRRARYKTKPGGRRMIVICFEHNDRKLLRGEEYLDVIDTTELGAYMIGELAKIKDHQNAN